jgi:AraC-like DNA-binding protein
MEAATCLLVLGEAADPGIVMTSKEDPYSFYYCRFRGDYAVALAATIVAARRGPVFPHPRAHEAAGYIQKMGYLNSHVYYHELPRQMGAREILLAQCLLALEDRSLPVAQTPLTENRIVSFLRERVHLPTNLNSFAGDLGVSRTTLIRKTKALTGQTVLELHERLKIEWAKTLLQSGIANVSETAVRVGYADVHYFCRVFRKRMGVPPGRWAKMTKRE